MEANHAVNLQEPRPTVFVSGRNGALVIAIPFASTHKRVAPQVRETKGATYVACTPMVMWTKLGVEYRKATGDLSAEAFTLNTCALMLSNEHGYDLRIRKKDMWELGPRVTDAALAELLREEWWRDDGDAYDISIYRPEWQLPIKVVEYRRKLAADRQDRKRRHDAGDHSRCLEKCPHVTRDVTGLPTSDHTRDPVRDGTDRNGYVSEEGQDLGNEPEPWPDVPLPGSVPAPRNGHVRDKLWEDIARGYDR